MTGHRANSLVGYSLTVLPMGPTNRDDSPGTGRNPDRYSRTEDVQAEETSHGRQGVGGGHPRRKERLQHTLVHQSRSRDAHRSRSRSLDRKRRRSYSRSRSRTPPARFRKAHSRSRSRSASPSPRRRRHNSHSPSRSRSRERHKRKSKKDRRKRSRSRSSSGSGSDYSGSDHRHTKKKHRPRGEKERRKKEKKEKKVTYTFNNSVSLLTAFVCSRRRNMQLGAPVLVGENMVLSLRLSKGTLFRSRFLLREYMWQHL